MTDDPGRNDGPARGIAAAGAYAPDLRIDAASFAEVWGSAPRGIESKSVPDADEDALTMAVEAARRALAAGDREGADVGFLGFGTTTPPLEEEDLNARLGSVLGAPSTVSGSPSGRAPVRGRGRSSPASTRGTRARDSSSRPTARVASRAATTSTRRGPAPRRSCSNPARPPR